MYVRFGANLSFGMEFDIRLGSGSAPRAAWWSTARSTSTDPSIFETCFAAHALRNVGCTGILEHPKASALDTLKRSGAPRKHILLFFYTPGPDMRHSKMLSIEHSGRVWRQREIVCQVAGPNQALFTASHSLPSRRYMRSQGRCVIIVNLTMDPMELATQYLH